MIFRLLQKCSGRGKIGAKGLDAMALGAGPVAKETKRVPAAGDLSGWVCG